MEAKVLIAIHQNYRNITCREFVWVTEYLEKNYPDNFKCVIFDNDTSLEEVWREFPFSKVFFFDQMMPFITAYCNEIKFMVSKGVEIYPFYFEMLDEARIKNELKIYQAKKVFSTYKYPDFENLVKVFHPVNLDVFKPSDIEKDIDVLLIGDLSADIYPLRKIYKDIIDSHLYDEHFKMVHYEHQGFTNDSPEDQITQYADLLRRSKVVLSCFSKFNYRLGKYSEIAACGAVQAGGMRWLVDDEMELFSIDWDEWMGINTFMASIAGLLAQPDTYQQVRKDNLTRVQKYSVENFCEIVLKELT